MNPQAALYPPITLEAGPAPDDPERLIVSWGEGSGREHFLAPAPLAAALVSTPRVTTRDDEVRRYADVLGIEEPEATALVESLITYGLLSAGPRQLTAAEERWIDVSWHDALSLHLATHDMKWLHDYTGSPRVMTKFHVDDVVTPTTPEPAPWRPDPSLPRVTLPAPVPVSRGFLETLAARRTSRSFRNSAITLEQVATILDWTLRPRWPVGGSLLYPSQTYSLGAPFIAYCLFGAEGAPAELPQQRAAYVYDTAGSSLALVAGLPDRVQRWADVLWGQSYADGAPMVVLLAVDWQQFRWKYRASRAYRWAYIECGGFMQTALSVATGLGLKCFQTPAIQDRDLSETLGITDSDIGVLYLAAFGS